MSFNESIIRYNRDLIAEFREHRNRVRNPSENFDDAQIAILNIIQALRWLGKDRIIKAIGNAKSPNAVSRALRSRLFFK